MGSKNDGKPKVIDATKVVEAMDKARKAGLVFDSGDADAKILATAFIEMSSDGLTSAEKTTIEKLDEILKDADITININNHQATIAQTDGKTFSLDAPSSPKERKR